MSRSGTVLGQPWTVTDDSEHGVLSLVMCDLDDFEVNRLTRGDAWADQQVRRTQEIAQGIADEHPGHTQLGFVPADSWVFTYSGEDESDVRHASLQIAEQWRSRVAAETDLCATVAVSEPHRGASRLEVAKGEAERAIEDKLLHDGDRVCQYRLSAAEPRPVLPERVETDLGRCIRKGDPDGAEAALRSWIERISSIEGVTPDMLRRWVSAELLYSLDVGGKRRLADGSTDWIESFDRLALDELLHMFDIHERSYLLLWLKQLFPRIVETQSHQPPRRNVLTLVEHYINEHYADHLRLATVANAVYVSPFYISHLFQRELETTFLQYLTGVRMQHARRLLTTTELPIEAISTRVGYYSPKRFRVLFKRTFDLTPTDYRHQYGSAD